MVPEGSTQACKGGKQLRILPSYDASEPQQWPAWHNSPKGVVIAHIPWQETNSSLIVLKPS